MQVNGGESCPTPIILLASGREYKKACIEPAWRIGALQVKHWLKGLNVPQL